MYDIFFISYREANCETNWQRLRQLHPTAKRIHGIKGIDKIHLACNALATTPFFWTVDGDNLVTNRLECTTPPTTDLVMYHAIDPITEEATSLGAVKLWRKNSFINTDMSRGDFTLNAVATKEMNPECLSISQYNSTPFDAWRAAFRHCVKLLSIILADRSADNREMYLNRWRNCRTAYMENARWAYQGYLDAVIYADRHYSDMTELNKINDYDWLEGHFKQLHGHLV